MSYESSRRPAPVGGASTASAMDIVASYSGQFAQIRGSIAEVEGESRDGSNNVLLFFFNFPLRYMIFSFFAGWR